MSESTRNFLLALTLVLSVIGAIMLGDIYLTEDGKMTEEQRVALIAEELDLEPKHITYHSDVDVKTINGDYIVDFGKDQNGDYFIRNIVRN